MLFEELVSVALLGTRGSGERLPQLPGELAATLPSQSDSTEARLLETAATLTLYSRAGAITREGVPSAGCAAPDRWPECSPRAADILAQLFEGRWGALLIEWLDLAAKAQRRAPHRLLPKLLDAAAGKKALQPAVSAIVDQRGRWLTQFNPSWRFTTASDGSSDEIWQTGNRPQRLEALRSVRSIDAAKARELIDSTWKDDAAEERALWLECLLVGLGDADEEFLEPRLDDRSGRVREVAADLLARLANSRLVARMTERLASLVSFTPGTAGQLLKLKRGTKPTLSVTLPEEFDRSMQRDGLTEKPSEKIGPKQWWLLQMIGATPLEYWTRTCGATPAELIEAVPPEYALVFLRGWFMALARVPVVEWIEPLITAAGQELHLPTSVLRAIPGSQRASALITMFGFRGSQGVNLLPLLEAWTPLDEPVSQLLIQQFQLHTLLALDVHLYLHPDTLKELETRFITWGQSEPVQQRGIDQALSAIALRREMHKEFAP